MIYYGPMKLIEKLYYNLSAKSRKRKFEQFLLEIKPEKDENIIDVGVNNEEYSESDNYLEKHYTAPQNITAVSKDNIELFKERYPNINSVVADGLKLPFPNNFFKISYSNAVIEHVGERKNQIVFLKELYRVSTRGYVTTPNGHFPIELHTRIPVLHLLLSKKYFDSFLRLIGKAWATGSYMNLLSRKDLVGLLEEANIKKYTLISNRIIGFPVTFSVIWEK